MKKQVKKLRKKAKSKQNKIVKKNDQVSGEGQQ